MSVKLNLKIPVWGVAAEDGKSPYLTSDGLPVRAFSRTEAQSFIDTALHIGHPPGCPCRPLASPLDLGTMEVAVELDAETLQRLHVATVGHLARPLRYHFALWVKYHPGWVPARLWARAVGYLDAVHGEEPGR